MLSSIVVFTTLLAGSLSSVDTNESILKNVASYELGVGTQLPVMLITLTANVVGCYLTTPTDETIQFKPVDTSSDKYELRTDSSLSRCSITIFNIEANDQGTWRLHSVDENGGIVEETFAITIPSADINNENSVENSSLEEDWIETYLEPERFVSNMGDIVPAHINLVGSYETHSCFIRTPNGVDYALESIEIVGVERLEGESIACGVNVHLVSEDLVGEWMLMSREIAWGSDLVERRLPFTIYVEELVNTTPKDEATVAAGNDFYIRLEEATHSHETCHVIGPNDDSTSRIELDSRYVENCGFIIKNVQSNDAGKWEIVYGDHIIYRAVVDLKVHVAEESTAYDSLVLTLDQPVNQTLFPENAIYCILEDPTGFKVYEGFGQCQLILPRATSEHAGVWNMKIGVPGKVQMQEHTMLVSVRAPEPKAAVTTHVQTIKPSVYMSCSVTSQLEPKACNFRAPSGEVLIANSGVGEDRYTIKVSSESTSAGHNYACELELASTLTSDLGLWRCAIETEEESYYGFLSVLCPWAMQDPNIAAQVEAEPVLKAQRTSVSAIEGDHVLLSCQASAPLTYCYVRSPNGSIYSVGSHTSTPSFSYAGAGLDAGECAVRFTSLSARDSGRWSCSAGHSVEQSVDIHVEVDEQMEVAQYLEYDLTLVVSGHVFGQRALDYCRFVRIDGFGFSTDISHENPNYQITGDLSKGECSLRLASPSILEHHPWSVVARLAGHDEEIIAVTPHSIVMPVMGYVRFPFVYSLMITIGLTLIIVSLLMIPRKTREWTYARADVIRSSVRSSFMKKPLKDVENGKDTPYAA